MLSLCTWKLRVNKKVQRKTFLCQREQINFAVRPSCGPSPAGLSVSVPSVSMCEPLRQHHMAVDSFHTSLPLLNKTYWTFARECWMEEEREKAVHPELPSVYGDAFFFFFPACQRFMSHLVSVRAHLCFGCEAASQPRAFASRWDTRLDAVQNANVKRSWMWTNPCFSCAVLARGPIRSLCLPGQHCSH